MLQKDPAHGGQYHYMDWALNCTGVRKLAAGKEAGSMGVFESLCSSVEVWRDELSQAPAP